MTNLFTSISKILAPGVKLETYSSLNQHLVGSQNIVLWNEDFQSIDDETYELLRIAIRKNKTCSFYSLNKTLPFHDFCIALLSSVDYGLNHTTAPIVLEKSYVFAWRGLVILANTGHERVQNWIKPRLNGRTVDGYTSTLGVNRQMIVNTKRRFSDNKLPTKYSLDEDKVRRACTSKKGLRDIVSNIPSQNVSVIQRSTATPEGQLMNLRIAHYLLLNKTF